MSVTQVMPLFKFAVRKENDIVTVRQKTRDLAALLSFDRQDQARLATVVSELARNVYQYAQAGSVEFSFRILQPQMLIIKTIDQGPGIANLDDILDGKYVSPSGMGVGLLGSKKLSDSFEVKTSFAGTIITVGKIPDKRAPQQSTASLNQIIEKLVQKAPGSAFEEVQNQNRDLIAALEEVSAAREELKQLNSELAETNRGVVALYAELDEKAESLRRSNEIKTSFLSNMTHEFRTPLSSVISLTRILLSRIDGDLTQEQERQVGYIQKSAHGLLELVNDLLDIAKVEAGKVTVDVKEFPVVELLGSLRGMFRPILDPSSNLKFEVELIGPTFVLTTDQAKIAQILRNLVSNALKFTESGGVMVTAQLLPSRMVEFKVTDTGLGIAPENMNIIFDDFSQIESSLQKKQKGTGLGLPLSRKLAHLLEGHISVSSQLGQGSEFKLQVPQVYTGEEEAVLISLQADANNRLGQEQAHLSSEHFQFLIIDDDEPSRYVLKSMLTQEIGARFIEASNGREALEKLKLFKPDAIFLDLAMPEMGGLDFLNAFRGLYPDSEIPVIVNTATRLSAAEIVYLKTLVTDVLNKDRTDEEQSFMALRSALQAAGFDYRRK